MRALCSLTALAVLSALSALMAAAGPKVPVGDGEDPNLAIDHEGTLHVVYVREKKVHYRWRYAGGKFEREITLGAGADPTIGLGPDGTPHIAMVGSINGGGRTGQSTLSYTRREGNSFQSLALLVAKGGCCKPRVRVTSLGVAVVVFEDRRLSTGRVRWVAIASDGKAGTISSVGDRDPGGLVLDDHGTSHLTWRLHPGYILQYTTVSPEGRRSDPVAISPPASDFSDLAVRPDGSMHVAGEAAHACGIFYIERTADERWLAARVFKFPEATDVDDPDTINPAIAVDAKGRRYITFTGAGHFPYYFVIDEHGDPSPVQRIDPAGGPTGGKYMNPHMVSLPGGGACVAWGSEGKVYIAKLQ